MKQQTVRLLRASGMVGICAFAFPAVCMAIEQGSPADVDAMGDLPSASIGLDASSIEWGGDPYAALDRLEELATAEAQPPGVFVREAGFPSDVREQHADTSGMVIGCTLDSPEDIAFAAVCDVLAMKGWACVPLQGVSGATSSSGKESCVGCWLPAPKSAKRRAWSIAWTVSDWKIRNERIRKTGWHSGYLHGGTRFDCVYRTGTSARSSGPQCCAGDPGSSALP